jgi:hypothetical protein
MRTIITSVSVLLSVAFVSPALAEVAASPAVETVQAAQAAPVVKRGQWLRSADGSRIGKIDSLRNGADGNPQWAAVIADSRFVSIPLSTITTVDKAAVTSLTRAEIRALR